MTHLSHEPLETIELFDNSCENSDFSISDVTAQRPTLGIDNETNSLKFNHCTLFRNFEPNVIVSFVTKFGSQSLAKNISLNKVGNPPN